MMQPGDTIIITQENHPLWPVGTRATVTRLCESGVMADFRNNGEWWVAEGHYVREGGGCSIC